MIELANKLKKALNAIESCRKQWKETFKNTIVTELNAVISEVDLNWFIEINDSINGHETISLIFRNEPSGLSFKEENLYNQQMARSGNITKFGGSLNFSFIYLGEVMVWMTYPYIPELLENTQDYIEINKLKLKEVNSSEIREAVKHFLKELVSWHVGGLGKEQRIGFKSTPQEEDTTQTT